MKPRGEQILKFWDVSSFGGVSTSSVERKCLKSERCPSCRRWIEVRSFEDARIHVSGMGDSWPDILKSNVTILHERVVLEMNKEGLSGYIAHPVQIVEIDNVKLRKTTVPQYFLIEVTGSIDVDLEQLDETDEGICPICFTKNFSDHEGLAVPLLSTWDGSDFVRTRNWNTALIYCTRIFIDLASKHRWTNFKFGSGHTMPGIGIWGDARPPKISYYDPDWFEKARRKLEMKSPELFF